MAEFKVVIDGLDLDEKLTQRINDEIQKVVLNSLADIDLTRSRQRGLVAGRLNPEWYGLWIKVLDFDRFTEIPDVRESIERLR